MAKCTGNQLTRLPFKGLSTKYHWLQITLCDAQKMDLFTVNVTTVKKDL